METETAMETDDITAIDCTAIEQDHGPSTIPEQNFVEKDFHASSESDSVEPPDLQPKPDSVVPSISDCERLSAGSSPSLLNFEMADKDASEKCITNEADHQLPSPNDVTYTENDEQNIPVLMEEKEDSAEPNKIICFVNQDNGKLTPSPILQYVLDIDQPFDTVISCADGKLGAHRMVLAAASPYIGDMFCSFDHRLGEIALLILPDIRVSIMKVLLNLCYTGSMFFPKEDEQEVIDSMKCLLMGEYGDLSLKEVTVKVEPIGTGTSPAECSENRQPEPQPGTSSSLTHTESTEDISSSGDEIDTNDDNEFSSDEDEEKSAPTVEERHISQQNAEQERLAFANNFLRHKKKEASTKEDSEVNYLVGLRAPGSKTKKLQCYHCPGAFKSVETLTDHLDNNHGIVLQFHKLKKSEFDKLVDCTYCRTKHTQISSANSCLSKHQRTRCFICFEIVRNKRFEEHIKSSHTLEQKNGVSIVKCRWCDAGLLLQDPIDNKAMSGHCYSSHFPGAKNGTLGIPTLSDFEEEDDEECKFTDFKVPQSSAVKSSRKSEDGSTKSTSPKLGSVPSKPVSGGGGRSSCPAGATPKGSATKATNKPVPAVLLMLQKASQKRKQPQEDSEFDQQNGDDIKLLENPKKRARLDSNGKRLQVAKRTGVPVGFLVDLDKLQTGIPSWESNKKSKAKMKSVLLDVTELPRNYVNFRYSKTFVSDRMSSEMLNLSQTHIENPQQDLNPILGLSFPISSPVSDTPTREVESDDVTKRRLADSRCSLPCL